jgi:hypothetical protein
MRQNVRFITVLTTALILFHSCKIDNGENSSSEDAEAGYFEDYASYGGKWGFIDTSGRRVIAATYDLVSSFSEGLAPVNFEGKWGYIDTRGKIVIPFKYRAAWQFQQGIGRVMQFDGRQCLIFGDGRTICPEAVDEIGNFSDGLAIYSVERLYGYLDTSGAVRIAPKFERAWSFNLGIARVSIGDKQGLINAAGEFVIKPEFDRVYPPSNQLILVTQDGAYTFLNMTGDRVSDAYGQATPFVDGVAAVGDKTGWYLIDLGYQPLFENRYSHIRAGGQGYWIARQASQLAVLNHEGEVLTPFQYGQINNFSEGFAGYQRNGLWGFLDSTGLEYTPPQFGLVWDFHDGFARAAFRDGIAFINTRATIPFVPMYSDARDFNNGLAPFQE